MTTTRKVYFDWDKDGTFTDMTAYAVSVSGTIGRADWKARVADVGMCQIELINVNREFSPDNTASPYYGQLVPNIPVRVEITDDYGTHRLFTVWTQSFEPAPDRYSTRPMCLVTCTDRIGRLQAADLSLPIQENQTAGPILTKIISDVYESGIASATLYLQMIENNDTITIGDRTYTFKSALTPADNEIALEARDWFWAYEAISDACLNLAAAINRDEGSGTYYAAGTDRHANVTALGSPIIGVSETLMDSQKNLLDNSGATNYEALAVEFDFKQNYHPTYDEPDYLPARRVYLYLKKVGNPTGTLTLRLVYCEAASPWEPSNTIEDANAIATVSEASLSTDWGWIAFDFAAEVEIYHMSAGGQHFHWLELTSDRAADASNYVAWGLDTSNVIYRSGYSVKPAGGAWDAPDWASPFIFTIGGHLDIEAVAHGAWGNALALAQTGNRIILPGATLTGGVDGLSGETSFETGEKTFEYAGDTWKAGETNALTAIQEITESEFGLFWVARNGYPTFKDQHYQFELQAATPALIINDDHNAQTGRLSLDDVINRATVSYRPRSLAASAVIAKASEVIKVPGGARRVNGRWNRTKAARRAAGERTVIVPYVDQGTAEEIGAIDIVQPLTPTTDYTVYDTSDKTGFNYTTTTPRRYAFALALTAAGVQLHIQNSATGPLYFHDVQVFGSALVRQNTTQDWDEDATSRAAYGLKVHDYTIPFPSDDIEEFAHLLSSFWVNTHKDPYYLVDSIGFYGVEAVNGTSIFSLEIGDLLVVSETQTAISAYQLMITGIEYQLPEGTTHNANFFVQRVNIVNFWRLDTAGYCELGTNTHPGL